MFFITSLVSGLVNLVKFMAEKSPRTPIAEISKKANSNTKALSSIPNIAFSALP